MEFSEVIKNRYSCKKFDSRQIEKEQLDQILEAERETYDYIESRW